MAQDSVTVDGHRVELSHPGKVLFPDDGLTKGDLVDYYRRIAEVALPHWRDRPLTMHRFPDGIGEEGFFQKNMPDHFPGWIDRAEMPKEGGSVTHVVANNAATLVYLANQGCITAHLGLSRTDRPDRPDQMIFDLDPSDDDFAKVQQAAAWLREVLDELELPSFVKTTGSRGLHVLVPLDRSADFDTMREVARGLAEHLAARHPDALTVAQRKNARGTRVFIDYLRNAYGQTAVAPYSVRARPGAPVATPVTWDAALASGLSPRQYTIKNIFRRLGQTDDPWAGIGGSAVSLASVGDRLNALAGKA
jgi:bifunctional non-homologous end joining protein LigD